MEKQRINRIVKLDDDLNGVFFSKGKKYVVSGVLKNELIEYSEKGVSANTVLCKLNRVIETSDKRIEPPCPYADKCGGCDLLHMPYSEQLKAKSALVKRKLLGRCDNVEAIVPSEQKLRNKIHIAFSVDGGTVTLGFFNEDTHKVINIEHCLLHATFYDKIRRSLLSWINKGSISLYNPKKKKGILRFALARFFDDKIQLTIVVTEKNILDYNSLYSLLSKEFNEVSLYECVNNALTNQVMSDDIQLKKGEKRIGASCASVDFSITPKAFFQTNSEMAEKIYTQIIDIIKGLNLNKPLILDLFSGIGITSTLFARNGFEVTSIEIVQDSVEEAKQIAQANAVADKITFMEGDVTALLPKFNKDNTIAFVDPPRGGLRNLTNALTNNPPRYIIYLSCNLRSALTDLSTLEKHYTIEQAIPFDMFPNTRHIETLLLLSRKNP